MSLEIPKPEAFLSWNGKELKTLQDVREEMVRINKMKDDKEAAEFRAAYVGKFGRQAEGAIFYLSGLSETAGEMADMLSRFTQRDCNGEFHIIELPEDEFGNTANKRCIRKVKIIEGYRGMPELQTLEPKYMAEGWPTISPHAWSYFVIDGPARMLTRKEWANLVDFKYSSSNF